MSEQITVCGIIGTDPRRNFAKNGDPITSFRLAAHQGHYDRVRNAWIEDESSWYSVTMYRQLAANAALSLNKGERVIVTGRLLIRKWTNGERSGTDVTITADSVGHDLTWYTTRPVRSAAPSRADSQQTDSQQTEPEPVESAASLESASAYDTGQGNVDRSEDGFVPVDAGADEEAFSRLDS